MFRFGIVVVVTALSLAAGSALPASAQPSPFATNAAGGFSNANGTGYWIAYTDGSVTSDGNAHHFGDAAYLHLNHPIVAGAAHGNAGYWLVANDGGVFSFGSARFHGSMGGAHLNQPVRSMAPTKTGNGYWLAAYDGGVFSFGDAKFYGSTAHMNTNAPIHGIRTTPTGNGYWLVGSDGGIFSFGDAKFYGSLPGVGMRISDVVGMASTPTGRGYWIARLGGQVYAFGDATKFAPFGASECDPIAAIFSNPVAQGYRLVSELGGTVPRGTAPDGATAMPAVCADPAP